MKKINFIIVLISIFLLLFASTAAFATEIPKIIIDGRIIYSDAKPVIIDEPISKLQTLITQAL